MENCNGAWSNRALLLIFLTLTLASADEEHSKLDSNSTFMDYDVGSNNETIDTPLILDTQDVTINTCYMPADPGPCTAEHIKFFYDSTSRRCRQFIYGGCDGNANNFASEANCLQVCAHVETRQRLIKDTNGNADQLDIFTDGVNQEMLTLANGHEETSFTFSAEYPFIQLKAIDISDFKLRCVGEHTLQ